MLNKHFFNLLQWDYFWLHKVLPEGKNHKLLEELESLNEETSVKLTLNHINCVRLVHLNLLFVDQHL